MLFPLTKKVIYLVRFDFQNVYKFVPLISTENTYNYGLCRRRNPDGNRIGCVVPIRPSENARNFLNRNELQFVFKFFFSKTILIHAVWV